MTSRAWYAISAGLILPGIALLSTGFLQLASGVEEMHRVVMPGREEIVLPVGRTTLYVEDEAIVDGKAYRAAEGVSFRCAVTGPGGRAVPLAPAPSVSYHVGGYAGRSAFDLDLDTAGTYLLACEGPGPFVMAIGQGLGAWAVLSIAGGALIGVSVLAFAIVLIKRVRQKRRAAAVGAG